MKSIERWCRGVRHHPFFEKSPLWTVALPCYNALLNLTSARKGLERVINSSDTIRVFPKWRETPETYEPAVWKLVMADIRPGDTVVDVGAFIGLYTIALAKRAGRSGLVFSYEPDPATFSWLVRHLALNGVADTAKPKNVALGRSSGKTRFIKSKNLQSHMLESTGDLSGEMIVVETSTLDAEFPDRRIDLMKIDVEGVEEWVLRGGMRLLQDPARCPRKIYIEVHPYAWAELGCSSASLLQLLKDCGYQALTLEGKPVDRIEIYGEIVASKVDGRRP